MDTPTQQGPEGPHKHIADSPQPETISSQEPDQEDEVGFFEELEDSPFDTALIKRNGWFILFVIACVLVSIGWPYLYMINLREVTSLEQKLRDIRYKSLFISAERIEYERIGNILDRVGEHKLQLVPATQPPYLLLDTGQYAHPKP